MKIAAVGFVMFWVGYLTACLMTMARGPKPPDYDDREWHDL